MKLEAVRIGSPVVIRAKGEFYAFVDGWAGNVSGFNNGAVEVKCIRADGVKTLFVPSDELEPDTAERAAQAARTCPPCLGNCQQGRTCPANARR